MPKCDIDYANTVIYKICCKNKEISDIYVGHTTNFTKRKYQHKLSCINNKSNSKIYKTIKENGGWDNWEMLEIATYNCKNSIEARIKEQEHYELLNSTLNTISPLSLQEELCCNLCNYKTYKKCDWDRHITTDKHIKNVKGKQNGNKMEMLETMENSKNGTFICDCGKNYVTHSGLWKHKKTCQKIKQKQFNVNETHEEKMDVYDLVKYLMKENSELKTLLVDQSNKMFDQSNKMGDLTMELVKNGVNNTTNNNTNHTNSHNKAFNLNFFLNETCKNAMNITDFVESIKLQLTDFMEVGEAGYVQGISNIIVKRLNDLDETIRPIHCTDQKRETFYVKDENKWEKEEDDMTKIRKMIKKVSYKNERLMSSYKEMFPDYNDPDSKNSDKYSKFVIEAMGGEGNNIKEKETKIIRNISRNVKISK